MKLTTKGRYAVTAMLDLALHYQQGAVTLSEIANARASRCRIWSNLFAACAGTGWSTACVVRVVATPRSGTGQNSAWQTSFAHDEKIDATRCGGKENCQGDERCLTHDLWHSLNERHSRLPGQVTLADLVAECAGTQRKPKKRAGRRNVLKITLRPGWVVQTSEI